MRSVVAGESLLVLATALVLAACGAAPATSDESSAADLAADTTRSSADGGTTLTIPAEVDAILASLKATHYQHDSVIDAATGTYDTDCSGFVNFVLQTVQGAAYDELQKATTSRALASSYVDFIAILGTSSTAAAAATHWSAVSDVHHLVPGDIIAWKIPAGVKSDDTGHVMIVRAVPVVAGAVGDATAQVSIVDSTNDGHGDGDPRTPDDPSGVGRGVIVLVVGADGAPTGYRWSTDADSPRYATQIVMAHVD